MPPVFEVRLAQVLVDGLWDALADDVTFAELLAFAVVGFVRFGLGQGAVARRFGRGQVTLRAPVPLGVRVEISQLAQRKAVGVDDIVSASVWSLPELLDRDGADSVWRLIFAARDERLRSVLRRLEHRIEVVTDEALLAALVDCQSALVHPMQASPGACVVDVARSLLLVDREVARRGLDSLHASMTPGFRPGR